MAEFTDYMVTTEDNPFDYWDQFEKWYAFDTNQGYNTLSYVMREAVVSDDMPDSMVSREMERAVDEIVALNLTGNYKKISRTFSEDERVNW